MRRVPLQLQSAVNECGLACLSMIAGTLLKGPGAINSELANLRRRFLGVDQGLTAKQITDYARTLGLASRGLRCEPQDLRRVQCPAILHWNMDHFLVLVKVTRRGCLVHDPARGRIRLSWQEIDRQFTGVVLEFWLSHEPGDEFEPTPRLGLMEFLPTLKGMGKQLFSLIAVSIVLQFIVLVGPWHVQWTVDEALLAGDRHLLGVLAFGFALVLTLRILALGVRGVLVIHVGHALSFRLAGGLLQHLLNLPSRWFDAHHIGDIASRFASLGPIRDLLTQGLAAVLVDAIMVFLSLGFMVVYSPSLAIFVCAVHTSFLAVSFLLVPRLRRFTLGAVVAQAEEQTHLLASIRCIQSVKIYGQESNRHSQWQGLHARTLSESMALQRTQLGMGLLASFVGGLELVCIIYFAANDVLNSVLSVGMLFAFLSYRGHFAGRLRGLVDQLVGLRTLQTHIERLSDIWLEPMEASATLEGSAVGVDGRGGLPKALALLDVGVCRSDDRPWLFRHLNLRVEPGEYVAIVGPSGSGKTTLIRLILGLAVPSEGHLTYNEEPLREKTRSTLREKCACVLQNDEFFVGSVLENLVLFTTPDLPRVHACLAQVDMTDTLRGLPMGIQTPVGGQNTSFSSGQLQRLMLARALYRQPQLLLLDEGTANLDVASVLQVQQVIKSLPCTRVVVTHDLSFAAGADRVFLLQAGELKQVELSAKIATTVSAG